MKYDKNASLILSIILAFFTLELVLVSALLLPLYIEWKCTNTLSLFTGALPTLGEKTAIYLLGYVLLICAAVADGLLIKLLFGIRKGLVFTPATVKCLRHISHLVMAIGLLFALLTPYFRMACAVGFVILFVGIVLKVVKNVIDEAVTIKSENDFTI